MLSNWHFFIFSQRILNHETFIMDLATANAAGGDVRPDYFRLYEAKTDLEMDNLFPASWDQLARRLATDDNAWERFRK